MNASLAIVTEDQPDEYPFSLGERPPLKFLMYDHNRYLNSETCLSADYEVVGAEHTLQMRAVHQDPPGTLPVEEKRQATLLGLGHDMERFRALVRRGLLRGWVVYQCISVDRERTERRMGHEALIGALRGGIKRRAVNANGTDAMRLIRLRDTNCECLRFFTSRFQSVVVHRRG